MKKFQNRYLPALCGLLLSTLVGTQSLAADGQIVIEDLTPSQLRSEIKKIETEFYRVFNAEVEDKNLAIICYDYMPTGSNIKEEACEPQFVLDKRADNANDSRYAFSALLTPQALRSELGEEYEALTEALTQLATENEYFRELNGILGALREELANR